MPTGTRRISARYASDAAIRALRTLVPRDHAAESADPEQDPEREREQDDGDRGRAGDIAALELPEHEDGGDLRLVRQVPRDQHDRPELADRPRERERDARQDRGRDGRQDDPAEDLPARRTERRGGVLHLAVELVQYG